ncbi:hypothetical protein LINPERHAP1_LOCUS36940, partial [Linum perenne]
LARKVLRGSPKVSIRSLSSWNPSLGAKAEGVLGEGPTGAPSGRSWAFFNRRSSKKASRGSQGCVAPPGLLGLVPEVPAKPCSLVVMSAGAQVRAGWVRTLIRAC